MPYIGRGLTTGAQYQKLDDIAINNATTFTMSVGSANVSPDQNHLILVVNGVIQEPGTGFTVAGSTCTLASAITTSGHSGLDTIYGVIAGDAAFAAYDSIGANALGVTAGTVTASRAIVPDANKDIASFRNVTLTGELDAATLDISGNADIDGTTNLDAVDIDGAVDMASTLAVGDAVTFSKSTNGDFKTKIHNANAGSSTEANIYITNSSSDGDGLFAGVGGTSFTTASGFVQDGAWIGSGSGASGGLSLMTRADADIRFYTNGHTNQRMIIKNGGNVGIGTASPTGKLSLAGASGVGANVYLDNHTADADACNIIFRKSRNATVGSHTSVNSADSLGVIYFQGSDGNSYETGATIRATADEAWSGSALGAALTFHTVDNTTTTLDERMRIDHNGKVGIGQTTVNAMLDIDDGATGSSIGVPQIRVGSINNSGVYAQIGFGWGGDTTYSPVTIGGLGTSGSGSVEADFVINTRNGTTDGAPDERMRVTHDGIVLILAGSSGDGVLRLNGTGANDSNLELRNDDALKWRIRNKGNESDRIEIRDGGGDDGVIMAQGATAFSSGSDERLKCNWTSFDNALSDINSLTKVGTFQYKNFGEDEPRNDKVHSGLSAQEVQKFLPSAVDADKEGEKFLSLRYQELIPVLIKAVQELSAKVEALENA